MTPSTASTLVFIDPTVDEYFSLIQGITPHAQAIVLDPDRDGVEQITQSLAQHPSLRSVQIVAHGSEGSLKLGSSRLNIETLDRHQAHLRQWATFFRQGTELLLYSCSVAAGAAGQAFVQQISQLTGAAVAAATHPVGCATLGANWNLGFTTGAIKTALAVRQEVLEAYPATLATFNVSTAADLKNFIQEANSNAEDDIIQINNDITLSLANLLPAITSNITFVGNRTISGAGLHQIFKVDASGAKVRFENLTIANGMALGSTGASGGGAGGNGLGGGLHISQGDVTLVNVSFNNNQAKGGQGGNATSGGSAGAGGNGLGGAIYMQSGSLRISTSSFSDNSAMGGTTGTVGTAGATGIGKGGAIYVNGGTVLAEGNPTYVRNSASSDLAKAGDDDNIFGSITTVFPPKVSSILCSQPVDTADPTVTFTVTFDQDVDGVNESDFQVAMSPPDRPLDPGEQAITNASLVSVTPAAGSKKVYTVTVNTGSGNGFLGLNLVDDDSIKNTTAVPLGATGLRTGDFSGQQYTVNKTPPGVFAINRKTPTGTLTAAGQVVYSVIFTDNVAGVDSQDFLLAQTGITGAGIASVTRLSGSVYDITVNTGSGNGQLGLNLVDNDTIKNSRNVVLGGTGASNGNFAGQVYNIDKTAPVVSSIVAPNPSPTKAGSVNYTVTFSQPVTGVDNLDFDLIPLGVSGASITSITSTDNKTYNVAVNTGSGDGLLRLDVNDNDTIQNSLGVRLGGNGALNGNFTGASYSLLKNAPLVDGITLVNPNPTASGLVNYAVTFSQDVIGVDATDFLPAGNVSGSSIVAVTGSGRNYNVQVNSGAGSGALGLNLLDNDSIVNAVGTPLGGAGAGNGNFAGQAYNVNRTPPRVTQINRLEANPTNAASVTFTVIFNENVIRVDPDDFQLVTQGVTGASITSITRVNSSFYTVAATTGNGDGSIGLNLLDNDSILNGLGVPLSGAGAGNGNFTGEVYRVDKTSPAANIVDVAPNPRRDKVRALTIDFSEAVQGFDLSDLQLTRNGQILDLSKASLTTDGNISWTLGNIKKLTNQKGDYVLSLAAGDSGIIDAAGNPLTVNLNERWTNLETVDACDPGIFRRGTPQDDVLEGTDDEDTLVGDNGNDRLIGLGCGDRLLGGRNNDFLDGGEGNDDLLGGAGNDTLVGGIGQDLMKGGAGRDRFVFSGASQAEALATSLAEAPDHVRDFKTSKRDRIQLDFDNNLKSKDRPRRLFNAGTVNGNSLAAAARDAYADKNQVANGRQALRSEEGVFFRWRNRTYLSVNDGTGGYATNRDLVVNMQGLEFRPGDANAGVLNVSNYFI